MRWWARVLWVVPLALTSCQEHPAQPRRTPLTVKPLEAPVLVETAFLYPGETLGQLLRRIGLAEEDISLWLSRAAVRSDLRRLPAWTPVVAHRLWGVEIRELRLRLGQRELVLARTEGALIAQWEQRPVREVVVVHGGPIVGSLFATVGGWGEGDALAVALAEVFAWQVDFHRDLQPGDAVKAVFVRQECEGERLGYGPVLAATLTSRGKTYTAFRYYHEGKAGFYDEQGRPLKRQFLRSPLPYSRVTSRFTLSRRHPVLGRHLPHFGVDYAAPEGTPVRVTADGVVSFVGWRGGGGKTVEVRHPGGYVTSYLHLSGFAPKVAVGQRVSQGEIIGYVGSTGLTTGPHLDYRVTHNGRYLNPARLGGDPAPPLPEGARAAFAQVRAQLAQLLLRPSGVVPPEGVELARAAMEPR